VLVSEPLVSAENPQNTAGYGRIGSPDIKILKRNLIVLRLIKEIYLRYCIYAKLMQPKNLAKKLRGRSNASIYGGRDGADSVGAVVAIALKTSREGR
jgi:hypothetical protein